MNYSTMIFLIAKGKCRAVRAIYEDDEIHKAKTGKPAPRELFKTFDPDIKVDDLVVVPTDSHRHGMTVVKVVEIDFQPDPMTKEDCRWIVHRVDPLRYEDLKAQEEKAIATLKDKEAERQTDKLRKDLGIDDADELRQLEIYTPGPPTVEGKAEEKKEE